MKESVEKFKHKDALKNNGELVGKQFKKKKGWWFYEKNKLNHKPASFVGTQ